jgi:hypothetical protein
MATMVLVRLLLMIGVSSTILNVYATSKPPLQFSYSTALLTAGDNNDRFAVSCSRYALFISQQFSTIVIDIFDITTLKWSTSSLSDHRIYSSGAATIGNQSDHIVIAGGQAFTGVKDSVDIFNCGTNQWSTAQLSEARIRPMTAAVEDYIVFAGRHPYQLLFFFAVTHTHTQIHVALFVL